jgi:hypothetical protein
MAADVLAWAVADVAGDVAAEARSDGPCWRLAAVEQRCAKRLRAAGGDHEPTQDAMRALLRRVHTAWSARPVPLFGVTTAGAARAPVPRVEGCGDVPHPSWPLPSVAAGRTAVCGAVARARQGLAAHHPTRRTGRPGPPAATPAARTPTRLAAHRTAVCAARSLCVQRPRHTTARKPLWRVSRGGPQCQARRAILEQGSA